MLDKVHIKNMVCPRCISAVQDIFDKNNIAISSIQLGEVLTENKLNTNELGLLKKDLESKGFELLEEKNSQTISQIKSFIIGLIQNNSELKSNFSALISAELNMEYSSLSRLFSSVEGITIEKYIVKQKIEKVKELLFYNQLNLSEIALLMNYSSTAHLSAQFKKEIGMNPSEFKKNNTPKHRALDKI